MRLLYFITISFLCPGYRRDIPATEFANYQAEAEALIVPRCADYYFLRRLKHNATNRL